MPRNNIQALEKISSNNHFNIVDLLLLDHSYLKECINIIKDKKVDRKLQLRYAKSFLDALKKHSSGEKNAIHAPLEGVKKLRPMILESEVEDGIIDSKVKALTSKLNSMHNITEELEAELKVLAEIVELHIEKEEKILFPIMRKEINNALLNEMGFQFMVIRQFSEKDLKDNPELQVEVPFVRDNIPIPSARFLNRTREYFNAQSSLT